MKKWLLIFCKPRQDGVAVENLQRQGFITYSPQIEVQRPVLGARPQVRTEPLFPGYVFLNVDPEVQSVAPVRSTKGVLRFVRFGVEYACAPQAVIDRIESNLALHARRMSDANLFRPGDRIRIDGSGFNGIDAIFANPCGAERAIILLNVLGREATISVPMAFISRADESAALDHVG